MDIFWTKTKLVKDTAHDKAKFDAFAQKYANMIWPSREEKSSESMPPIFVEELHLDVFCADMYSSM